MCLWRERFQGLEGRGSGHCAVSQKAHKMEGQGQRLWGLSARFQLALLTQLPLLLQQLHGCFS